MTTPTRSLRSSAALLALLLLAFALRVYALDAQSLWYDEAVTAQVAQQGLGELAQWTADDIQPPLYYALVAGWAEISIGPVATDSAGARFLAAQGAVSAQRYTTYAWSAW